MSRSHDNVGHASTDVLVLQHAECESLGRIEQAIRGKGLHSRYVRSFDGDQVPPEIGNAAALIVMGGPMSVYEQDRYPFLVDELRLVQRTVAAGKPTLGICLGSQLLAAALGGSVTAGPRKESGWHPIRLRPAAVEDPLLMDLPLEFPAFHWHGDVFSLPPQAESLASSALTAHQAFRYGANAYGFLFHLEVTETLVDGMVRTFAEELESEGILQSQLAIDTQNFMPGLQATGELVFARWADRISRSYDSMYCITDIFK